MDDERIRSKSRQVLQNSLETSDDCSVPQAKELADTLEESVRSVHETTDNAYRAHVRNLSLTLSKDNEQLRDSLVSGELSAEEIGKSDTKNLKSDELQARIEKMKKEAMAQATGVNTLQPRGGEVGLTRGAAPAGTYDEETVPGSGAGIGQEVGVGGDASGDEDMVGGGVDAEGEYKERMQPSTMGTEGIEFDTGNS